ncbi:MULTISPECIES: amidase family protein [unclassified Mesorhizobium]|uniref:amidase family protein n=1 Tax=unclassified Mesorhizobium TaxID=325217 RepID=UPI0019263E3F|nr:MULTISPECIES: amidase family protein [unclassified Mesorhizobium]
MRNEIVPFQSYQVDAKMPFEVREATVLDMQAAMASGQISSAELVTAHMARIEAFDQKGPCLNAMICLNPNAGEDAVTRDAERQRGHVRGPLHGIPVILKDNYTTREMPTTAGSVSLATLQTTDDAFQVKKLRDAGAIILGKANMDDLSNGSVSMSSVRGQTLNPYDLRFVPGGSSGGSAVSVAASFAPIAFGTDTGISIRLPASANNLFGLRPTKGLSSITGIVPRSRTHDTAGPMARNVADLAIALDATVGYDPKDPATRAAPKGLTPRFLASLNTESLRCAKFGLVKNLHGAVASEVSVIIAAATETLRKAGASTVELELPLADSLNEATVWNMEFKFDLAEFLAGIPSAPVQCLADILEGGEYYLPFEEEFRLCETSLSLDTDTYRTALAEQVRIRAAVVSKMDELQVDALVYPITRVGPVEIGKIQPGDCNGNLSAVTGLPALAVPAGFSATGLPVGMEWLGRPFADELLVQLAYGYEVVARPRRVPSTTPALS